MLYGITQFSQTEEGTREPSHVLLCYYSTTYLRIGGLMNVRAGLNTFWEGAESGNRRLNTMRTRYTKVNQQVQYILSFVFRGASVRYDLSNTEIKSCLQK